MTFFSLAGPSYITFSYNMGVFSPTSKPEKFIDFINELEAQNILLQLLDEKVLSPFILLGLSCRLGTHAPDTRPPH